MTTRTLAVLLSLGVLTTATNAAALCVDNRECICPSGYTVAGVVQDVNGTSATLVVERAHPETGLAAGETLPLNRLPEGVTNGTRVVAEADAEATPDPRAADDAAAPLRAPAIAAVVPRNGRVACVGTTFTEVEAIDLAMSADCRARVDAIVGVQGCNDTGNGEGCSASPVAPTAGSLGLLVLAVAGLCRRRVR